MAGGRWVAGGRWRVAVLREPIPAEITKVATIHQASERPGRGSRAGQGHALGLGTHASRPTDGMISLSELWVCGEVGGGAGGAAGRYRIYSLAHLENPLTYTYIMDHRPAQAGPSAWLTAPALA